MPKLANLTDSAPTGATKQLLTCLALLTLLLSFLDCTITRAQTSDIISEQILRLSPSKQYRYFHQRLESYFDSGNGALLDTLAQQANTVAQVYGNGYFVKLVLQYERMRSMHVDDRLALKTQLQSSAAGSGETSAQLRLDSYESSIHKFLEMGDTLSAIITLQQSAYLQAISGRSAGADSTLQRSIALSRLYGDQDALARSFSLLGGLSLRQGDYLRAGESFDSARVIRTILYDTAGVASCLKNIGAVYQAVGQRREAFRFTVEALRRFNLVGDSTEALDATLNLVSSFADLQSTEQISERVAEVELLLPTKVSPLTNARYLYGKAVLFERLGDYDSAMVLVEAALMLDQTDQTLEAALHNLAGNCSTELSDFGVSREHYEKALELSETRDNKYGMAVALNNLGSLNQRLGRFDQARELYDSAQAVMRLAPELGGDATLSTNLFDLYLSARDTASARLYLQQVSSILTDELDGSEGIELVSARCRYLAAIGETDSALALLEGALSRAEGDCQDQFDLTCLKAEICRRSSRLDAAFEALGEAEQATMRCNSAANARRLSLLRALWQFDRKLWKRAAATLAQLIADIEQSQASLKDLDLRISFLSQSRFLYEKMAITQLRLFQQSGDERMLDSMLVYSELCKARGLRDLRGADATDMHGTDNEVPSLRDLMRQLPGDAALLYFLLTQDGSIRLFVSNSDYAVDLIPAREGITTAVSEYSRLIQESISDEAKLDSLPAAGDKLGKLVLGGIAGKLKEKSSLFVSPDGGLSLIPCASLRLGGEYLVEVVAITTVPALGKNFDFGGGAASYAPPLRIVAVGIAEAGDDLTRLKNAPQEIEWISEVRSNDTVAMLVDSVATLSAVAKLKPAEADILHLATHTTIDYSEPENSAIWFVSEDRRHARSVSPRDLFGNSKLRTKLVVLSACESGGGSYELSEGLVGFVQEFLGRGASEVLVSHWEVEDFTSSVLMRSFYSNLDLGPARALQRAQIELIKSPRVRHRHPYYWAPFVLIKAPR